MRVWTAYGLLEELKNGNDTPENRAAFLAVREHLGYGLLLKRYTDNGCRCHRRADQESRHGYCT